jgi:serine/threonine-protein kinase
MVATWARQKELRLGRYVLKRPLGEGGNGQVFLAWQENEAGEPLVCVVKFPLQRYATQADGRERFLAEARLAMRLGMHPNIVYVIDVGRHRDMPFIVMEYIDGTDLHHLLNVLRSDKQGLSLASAYNILASTAEALHHAHAGATIGGKPVGVVHRDIKPGNILVTRDGITKVGDFGIGATIEEGTSGNFMRGTHRYMSPEHLRCEVRPEMDIYALGVVGWEILENRQFREGFRGAQHFTAIMDGQFPPMENPKTPKQLVSIIEACLESNPRQRPMASEVLRALERCPGYTRDPSSVKADITRILGRRRSSGQTQHEFTATPELVATLAALEAVQTVAGPAGSASEAPARAAAVEGRGVPAPTTLEGVPPLGSAEASEVEPEVGRVPASDDRPRPDGVADGSNSDAETPVAQAAARPSVAGAIIELAAAPPADAEEDAPRERHRPRSQPTPTLPLTGEAGDREARESTMTLAPLATPASSGTEFVAPPWRSDATGAERDAAGDVESGAYAPAPELRRASEPGVAPPPRPSGELGQPVSRGSIEAVHPATPRPATEPGVPPPSRGSIHAGQSPSPRPSGELGSSPSSRGSIETGRSPSLRPSTEPGSSPSSREPIEAFHRPPPRPSTAPGLPASARGSAGHSPSPRPSTEPGLPPSRGSIEPLHPSTPRPQTEPAHAGTQSGPIELHGVTADPRAAAESFSRSFSDATSSRAAAPIAASRPQSSLRRDAIYTARKLWPLGLALAIASGLLTAYLLTRQAETNRTEKAREPSRTTQMWPIPGGRSGDHANAHAGKTRHGGQAWQDGHGVTVALNTAPMSRRSAAIAFDRGGSA